MKMKQVDKTKKYALEELPIDTSGWELKKLRQWVGHDTNLGFVAELHIDGKKVADIEDDSMGGGMFISPESRNHREMLDKITETLKQYPKMFWSERGWDTPSGCDYLSWEVDEIIEELIQREEDRRWIKKKTRTHLLFKLPKHDNGTWGMIPRRFKVSDKDKCIFEEKKWFEAILKKHPDVTQIVGFRTREDWSK